MNGRWLSRSPRIALNNGKSIVLLAIQRTISIKRFVKTSMNLRFIRGKIQGVGPRYCPSIEDKVVKFADKDRHQLFLEPEGHDTNEVYLNGFSTSLPAGRQQDLVRMIPGLENARIIRPGYAIEYDFVDPRELGPDLQCRRLAGFFNAGQINGTTGYEEAACQGLMAGINAALAVQGRPGLRCAGTKLTLEF